MDMHGLEEQRNCIKTMGKLDLTIGVKRMPRCEQLPLAFFYFD